MSADLRTGGAGYRVATATDVIAGV
jgi:hypothetical protein